MGLFLTQNDVREVKGFVFPALPGAKLLYGVEH